MPQKRNHDFTQRYPNIKAGTYEPMTIKEILIKNRFFCRTPPFYNMSKTHKDLKFGKERKMLVVVDTSLLPLNVPVVLDGSAVVGGSTDKVGGGGKGGGSGAGNSHRGDGSLAHGHNGGENEKPLKSVKETLALNIVR